MMANKINASWSCEITQRIMMALMDLSQKPGHCIICRILKSATKSRLETGDKINEPGHRIMNGLLLPVHSMFLGSKG